MTVFDSDFELSYTKALRAGIHDLLTTFGNEVGAEEVNLFIQTRELPKSASEVLEIVHPSSSYWDDVEDAHRLAGIYRAMVDVPTVR